MTVRRNPALRILALVAVLLFAVSAACGSDPEPTATTPATATTAPTEAPAATATTAPAAEPTATPADPTTGSVSATTEPSAGLEPEATVSGTLAASPTEPPADPTEAPTATAAPSAPPVGVNVGNTLPHFEMTLVDGSRVSTELLAHQGKPVFLYFFTTW